MSDRGLDTMWGDHSEYLKRMLISMTRDADLSEDLLQETYLRALAGIGGYRGGDSRAWLATIARNAFYNHIRSRYTHAETPLDPELYADDGPTVGTLDHVTLIALRQAISDLPPDLRKALLMKHYGGFNYKEIASRQGCPAGTSQFRVWSAIRKLRSALGDAAEESPDAGCPDLTGVRVLDYLYRAMPADEARELESHFADCPECREEVEKLRKTVTALDAFECEFKRMYVLELNAEGGFVVYYTESGPSILDHETDVLNLRVPSYVHVTHLSVYGQEVPFDTAPCESREDRYVLTAKMPRPMRPGEVVDFLLVGRDSEEWKSIPVDLGGGRVRLSDRYLVEEGGNEEVRAMALRLPEGARLIDTIPPADEVRSDKCFTIIWRRLLSPGEEFSYSFEYRL